MAKKSKSKPINKGWYLAGGFALLIVVPFVARAAKTALTAESLQYSVVGVKDFKPTSAGLEFDLLVSFQNPSGETLNIQGFFIDVSVNGSRLGKAVHSADRPAISVASWREGVYPLKIRLGWVDMGLFLAVAAINAKAFANKPTITVEVTGQLRVNEITLPVALNREVPNFVKALIAQKGAAKETVTGYPYPPQYLAA